MIYQSSHNGFFNYKRKSRFNNNENSLDQLRCKTELKLSNGLSCSNLMNTSHKKD